MEAHALHTFEIAFRREARRGDPIRASDERGTLAMLETHRRSANVATPARLS